MGREGCEKWAAEVYPRPANQRNDGFLVPGSVSEFGPRIIGALNAPAHGSAMRASDAAMLRPVRGADARSVEFRRALVIARRASRWKENQV